MKPHLVHPMALLDLFAAVLLGYAGAWILMRAQLSPEMLKAYEPTFLRLLKGVGAAPDQYRVLQNQLLGLLYRSLGAELAVLHFTAVSLACVVFLFLRAGFPGIPQNMKRIGSVLLVLLYPVLMFRGPRADSAFILLLALGLALAIESRRTRLFFALLLAMTLTRADVALFAALFALVWDRAWLRPAAWGAAVALPLAGQALLQFVVFPDAKYYCDVIMLRQSLAPRQFLTTPVFALIAAALLLGASSLADFLKWLLAQGTRGILFILLFLGYLAALATVAIMAETRLLLPLAPFALLLIQSYRAAARP